MIRNYFTIVLRNFLRNPIYSAINVSGLVLGLSCSIFIFLWVLDEMQYDQYHKDNARVYKVMWNHNFIDQGITTAHWTSGLLAEELKAEIPEIEQVARVAWSELKLFKHGEYSNYESGDYADKTIFDVLNLKLIEGNILHALPNNNSIAISEKMATRFFKTERALGKTLRMDNKQDVTVTAVFGDLPENTTEKFEFILPFELYIQKDAKNLIEYDGSGWQFTLIKLIEKSNKQLGDLKMVEYFRKHEKVSSSPPPPPFLLSMLDWHLHDNFTNGKPSGGRISYVVSFSLVAILILIIACINFMNLSTARSMNRSREVGIRKVAGASRSVLIRQFLTESILLSFLSLFIALLIVHLFLPLFNSFTEKHIALDYFNPVITISLIGIALLTGLIAGSYPAFFLSSFRPASVLKGNLQAVFSGADLRRGLVVFQFGLSMVIIIAALVVNEQIEFMRNKNLGFDKNNVVYIEANDEIAKNYSAFRNELLQNPLIESVSRGDCNPMEINGESYYSWNGKSPDDDSYFNEAVCDYDYLETLGFTFIQGRNFSPDFPSDSTSFIITEEAVNRMGFSNPIGQYLDNGDGKKGQIIGVIKDFNNLSIQQLSHPTSFRLKDSKKDFDRALTMFVRYKAGALVPSLEYMKTVYKRNASGFPIQFRFIDEEFEKQFKGELVSSALSTCFTVMAIIISCLGLFGLASFSTERRTKEIGVRKVLGASIRGLTVLLCKDFTRLIVYSIIIGSPVAYYVMEKFLNKYPYHTELNFWMFAAPAIVMLSISLSIILFQSIKAALGNPVEALRGE